MAPGETRVYRMTTERDLFRQEAIDARRGQWPGMISVAILLSRWVVPLLGAGLATAIIVFLVLAHCTDRPQLNGQPPPPTGRKSSRSWLPRPACSASSPPVPAPLLTCLFTPVPACRECPTSATVPRWAIPVPPLAHSCAPSASD